MFRFFIITSEH